MSYRLILPTLGIALLLGACVSPAEDPELSVDYEKFELENGLDVVFHIDRSDPIVAVAMTYHVGSAREEEGRTGFAHLFEHLLFLESENLGKGGLDILINKVGGSLNGSTSHDRTNYFQVVPNDALEKIIWAEADKMGFFINTVTQSVVDKERQVVKNEKRQSYDNRPYGHNSYVIDKALYPAGHPYNWQVIGSLADLDAADLQDVKEFYRTWYGPNNATMVIAGDFDPDRARTWVQKYFGEFESRGTIPETEPMPASLSEPIRLMHEDNFARLPQLTMAWPTVAQYDPDSYALDILSELLASGKKSPIYKVLVEKEQLTSGVSMYDDASELAGKMQLTVRAFPDTDLDAVEAGVQEAFRRFETEGFDEKDLERIKAGEETSFYNGLSSVLGKAFQLAQYNIFAGDPGYVTRDIEQILAVTSQDVMRAYEKYIKDQPFIATSFVPDGESTLALEGSKPAEVVEEPIVQGAEDEFVVTSAEGYQPTPSTFDRTVEPPFGPAPDVHVPDIWTASLENGIDVYGVESDETPLVQFSMRIQGGLLVEDPGLVGVSNFLSEMLMAGTARRTPEELEEAIDQLGATIGVGAGRESLTIGGNTLARNYEATLDLVQEILLEPRWDMHEFDLIQQRILNQIRQQDANPNAIASNTYNVLLYGADHILSKNPLGTLASVERITMEDLQTYYDAFISPAATDFHIAGDISREEALTAMGEIESGWNGPEVQIPEYSLPEPLDRSQVYFVDIPGAVQSVLRVGYLALAETDDDFYPATVMNFKLGGGGFASKLLQTLREQKGYTYGVGSGFSGSDTRGPFTVATSVRSNVTLESLTLIKDIMATYADDFDADYLDDTRAFMIKSNARRFETLGAKLGILYDISAYDWSHDFPRQQEEIVRNMTVDEVQQLARTYVNADRMIYLVVGDAHTQLPRLRGLGFGNPIRIDRNGNILGDDSAL